MFNYISLVSFIPPLFPLLFSLCYFHFPQHYTFHTSFSTLQITHSYSHIRKSYSPQKSVFLPHFPLAVTWIRLVPTELWTCNINIWRGHCIITLPWRQGQSWTTAYHIFYHALITAVTLLLSSDVIKYLWRRGLASLTMTDCCQSLAWSCDLR